MPAIFKKGLDLNAQRLTNLADASAATDGVTLQQLTALVQGINDLKDPVRAISTTNLTLSAPQTVDGVSLIAGDRVLVAGQTLGQNNGIYVVAAGAWTRATDADVTSEVSKGMSVTVMEGTNKGTGSAQSNPLTYNLTTNNPITLGTTPLVFAPLGAAVAVYLASNGLQLIGSTFSVLLDTASGLIVSGTGLKVDTSVVTKKYAADCVVTTNPQTFTHNLGTNDVEVHVWEGNTKVYPDITKGSGTVIIDWGSAPTAAQYRVVVQG